ncbi:hypothetical protein AWJ20_3802 [Sugiyamaella lignohabitans]|uniref:Uncharacterized protein n=1 Tax=Sugiyamaella lignohabitans TaxID=796027 RepID=A0A161HIL2_9ASCO|nr:uncharacterized protein AWJ20_3802 [Sugiyamaella lignohabitans]ANB11008.1 hypothetical protein AWJ20_3802 [Sugiyamaella lignohabitans]
MEIREREVEALKDRESAARKEATALSDGVVVWKDTCETVSDLERRLSLLPKQDRSDVKKISTMLNETLARLTRNLDVSEDNKWSLLSVAISQEVEALKQGIELVESMSAPPSSTSSSKVNSPPTAVSRILPKISHQVPNTALSSLEEPSKSHIIVPTPKTSPSPSFTNAVTGLNINNVSAEPISSSPTQSSTNAFNSVAQLLGNYETKTD